MASVKFNVKDKDFVFMHSVREDMKDWLYMSHSHNAYEILFITHGDATYVIEDRKYKLKKNDLIFTRPNKHHYIQLDSDVYYERYNITFNEEDVNLDIEKLIPKDLEIINCSGEIIGDCFKKADYYSTILNKDAFIDVCKCLLKEILYALSTNNETASVPAVVSPIISSALKYINENLFAINSVSEISDFLFVTETYLFKIFKEQLKISPKKYIVNKRLLVAQKMISSGKKPTEIYVECGFQTYPAFYKRYIEFFGYPPSKTP